ncbi:flagellar biosynthetic protein FliR [bacterium]|nr:flagellar biosynthetic protein FliR [bacterium]
MDILGLFEPIIAITLVSIRVTAFWLAFPFVMSLNIPQMVRIAGALTISMALYPLVQPQLPAWTILQPPTMAELVAFCSKEFIIGIGLGFLAKFIFSSAIASASWLGSQMGFSMGGLVNPDFQETDTAWGALHGWLALMIYLSIGGHWFTIQALAESYTFTFVDFWAHLTSTSDGILLWSTVGQSFFVWMLKLAGPMLVVVMLLQAGMGVLSKFVPQINVWMVSIPVTLGVGVFVFMMLLPMYAEALKSLMNAGTETQYLWLRYLGAR